MSEWDGATTFVYDCDLLDSSVKAYYAFIVFVYVIETSLSLRQRSQYKVTARPKVLEPIIEKEKFDKAQAYGLDKNGFSLFTSTWGTIQTLLVLLVR